MRASRRGVIVGAIAVGAAVAGGVTWQRPSTSSVPHVIAPVVPRAPVPRRETRPTLDPARFTGKAAQAYRVAREIPEVLDQLQCHCSCGSEYGHVSLLSCYADGHGAT